MTGTVGYQPPKPPDWAKLRAWLLSSGPQTLSEIVRRARVDSPVVSEDYVRQKLAEKRRLYRLRDDGRWEGVADMVAWVPVYPKPRPQFRPTPAPPMSRQPAAPQTPARPARRPASTDPFRVVDGELVSVVFSRDSPRDGAVYESGGRILLPVPQDAEASDVVRPAILAAAAKSAEVEVWEAVPGAEPVFRGTRTLLQAAPGPVTKRVNLVLERAGDDEGRRPAAKEAGTPLLLPPGTRSLALALPDLVHQLRLTESQRKLASLPLAPRVWANR